MLLVFEASQPQAALLRRHPPRRLVTILKGFTVMHKSYGRQRHRDVRGVLPISLQKGGDRATKSPFVARRVERPACEVDSASHGLLADM